MPKGPKAIVFGFGAGAAAKEEREIGDGLVSVHRFRSLQPGGVELPVSAEGSMTGSWADAGMVG